MSYPVIYDMDFDKPCKDNQTLMLFDVDNYYSSNNIHKCSNENVRHVLFPNIRFELYVNGNNYKLETKNEMFMESVKKCSVLLFTKNKRSCIISEFTLGTVVCIKEGDNIKNRIITQLNYDNNDEVVYCVLIYNISEWDLCEIIRRLQFIKEASYNQESKENLFKIFLIKYNDIIIQLKDDNTFNTARKKYLNDIQNELVQPVNNNHNAHSNLHLTNKLSYLMLFELPETLNNDMNVVIDLNNENIKCNNNDIVVLSIIPFHELNTKILSFIEPNYQQYTTHCYYSNIYRCLFNDHPLSFIYGKQLAIDKAIYYKSNTLSGEIIYDIQTHLPIGIGNIILSNENTTTNNNTTVMKTFLINDDSTYSNAFTFLNFSDKGFISLMKEYFKIESHIQ